jgi:hypothetical protein
MPNGTTHGWNRLEDHALKRMAATCTAREIASRLNRTVAGVRGRAKRLGILLTKKGENHWNSKLTSLEVAMAITLYEAGFSVDEIYRTYYRGRIAYQTLNDAVAARTWR